jgi:predicted flavoprotein YhiN
MGMTTEVDVLILGGGAAGLMCAIEAGRRGRRVLLLEHADGPGKKILISGGGRCNFTNRNASPENFLCANPHFAKSALARFTPQDFIALVEKHGIAYHEKTLGQLFCDRSARQILDMLLSECAEAGVRIQTATRILSVTQSSSVSTGSAARFRVEISAGAIVAASLVVATGGLSIPQMGATSFGYDLARQFGHRIVETHPGLVPLVFNVQDQADWCDLAGVSAEVIASVAVENARGNKIKIKTARSASTKAVRSASTKTARSASSNTARSAFRERMLLTHRGLSGPAILQVSSYWRPGESIELDLAPESAADAARRRAAAPGSVESIRIFSALTEENARRDVFAAAVALRDRMPSRMADRWLRINTPDGLGKVRSNILRNTALAEMEQSLHRWSIAPAGTEGYAKAEVTVGGVDTDELDARTMQSRRVPGLYFIGEVVDVTGWLGGYNFQWAWASGASAGRSA